MPATPLLERADNLAALNDLLAGVESSRHGRLVLLGGEAGVGKTALLRAFCESQPKAVRILRGACEPLYTPHPLAPLLDVGAAIGGQFQDAVEAGARPHLVAAAVLAELRIRPPTLLVLEDLHWADEATLDVIALLATRIASAPALVVGSFRDDELDAAPQLRWLLGEVVRRPGRLKVERLSPAAVAELAAPHGLDAEELFRSTGGNPFFVTEVLAAGAERVPTTVRDAVLARAARLTRPGQTMLEAVAVVPQRAEVWLLEALADGALAGIDECVNSGMLRSEPGGSRVQARACADRDRGVARARAYGPAPSPRGRGAGASRRSAPPTSPGSHITPRPPETPLCRARRGPGDPRAPGRPAQAG
jgi:AAA ATPase domain